MLLFDFVDDDVFAAGLSEFVVEDGAWDGGEEKHVQEDEDDEVNHVGLVVLKLFPYKLLPNDLQLFHRV